MPIDQMNAKPIPLPVIPLAGTVAFPYIPITFEAIRDVTLNALNRLTDKNVLVFIAFCADQDVFSPGIADLHNVGIIARIEDKSEMPGETVKVTAKGFCRARATGYTMEDDTIIAHVITEPAPDEKYESGYEYNPVKEEALRREIMNMLRSLVKILPPDSRNVLLTAKEMPDLGQLCDYIAYSIFTTHEDKIRVIDEYDPIKRADIVTSVFVVDGEYYKQEVHIHQKIQKQLERSQYENYLREKLKVIKDELGDDNDEIEEFESKIESTVFSSDSETNEKIRTKLFKELSRLAKTPSATPEANVIKNYLEVCFDLPWNIATKDNIDVNKAKELLDNDHDGLVKPKERILEYLAVKQLNPDIKNQIICLIGPPGIGKTSLGISVAKAMGRKFAEVSLGGIHDEAEIRGHRKTYIGSMPGRIIAALQQAGSSNPLLLLDEIDKMSKTVQGDPASAMLEVLDPEQNKNFRDNYLEIPYDLSNCMFIATANSIQDIPTPLLDRMEVIELGSYTDSEKKQIAKNHLVPKQLKRHGLSKKQFTLKDDALNDLIQSYTREAGVRNLEREIASLCRKVAKGIAMGEFKSCTVNSKNIEKFLGPRHDYSQSAGEEDLCGVVNGLAYTTVGGDLLKIETCTMSGDGKIQLTGTLGDVMKESARIAVSYIRANSEKLGVAKDFNKTLDLHIHVPEGATPKDGPSAGITMLTSLVSALTSKKVDHRIAMTGELTLTGRVLPIGGLKEKTFAAYKAGIKSVIIPKDNVPDLSEIDSEVRKTLKFIPVTDAVEVLRIALV